MICIMFHVDSCSSLVPDSPTHEREQGRAGPGTRLPLQHFSMHTIRTLLSYPDPPSTLQDIVTFPDPRFLSRGGSGNEAICISVEGSRVQLASFPGSPGMRICIHTCTTSMFTFRSVGAWERGQGAVLSLLLSSCVAHKNQVCPPPDQKRRVCRSCKVRYYNVCILNMLGVPTPDLIFV